MDIDGLEGARVAEMIYRRRVAQRSSSLNIQKWNSQLEVQIRCRKIHCRKLLQVSDDDEERGL